MIRELARRAPGFTWVAAFTILGLVAIGTRIGAPLQPILVVIVVLTCPGFLLLDLTQPRDLQARIMLGIGASIAFNLVLVNLVLVMGVIPLTLAVTGVLVIIGVWKRKQIAAFIASLRLPVGREPARVVAIGNDDSELENDRAPDAAGDSDDGDSNDGDSVQEEPQEAVHEEPDDNQSGDVAEENIDAASNPGSDRPPVLVLGIDINNSAAEDLTALPEVGPELAARIIDNREEHGPFASVDDLLHTLVQLASDSGPATHRNLDSAAAPAFDEELETADEIADDIEADEAELPPTGKR